METQHANTAVDAHKQAAEKLAHAEGSVRKALDEIQDISRGMRAEVDHETDGKSLPSESEMQEAVDRARDANRKEKCRQAEQESYWRLLML